jgi:hypothetical protein
MKNKSSLKHKRNEASALELVDKLIQKSLLALESGEIKASVSDCIRLVEMRTKLCPVAPAPVEARWVDSW